MIFSKAQQEFQIRYYLWATAEFEKEIVESFPNLRLFKAGTAWETYQFMRQLDKHDQLTLAHALLKRSHPDAVKVLGESCSPEEVSLRAQRDDFFRIKGLHQFVRQLEKNQQTAEARTLFKTFRPSAIQIVGESHPDDDESLWSRLDAVFQSVPSTFEEELATRKKNGEKINFVSKRKLQKAVTVAFKSAFGGQCVNFWSNDKIDPSSMFDMECCGWIISTQFWFGRRESLINYTHLITSPTRVAHPDNPEITAPTMLLANCISFGGWMGITSQIQWQYLTDGDVEPACDAVMKLCGHFFEVAPKLLKGLEFEKIEGAKTAV
jgi:hypothetical protein